MEISCLKCGKSGAAYEEICCYCGTKYPLKTIITDVDMPFWSIVLFMVKWAFASIPAIFIIVGILLGIFLLLAVFFGSIGGLIK